MASEVWIWLIRASVGANRQNTRMTQELFRENAYLKECTAVVAAIGEQGIVLDRTVFYPLGGGQAGDSGVLVLADGGELAIADTRKAKDAEGRPTDEICHLPAPGPGRAAGQPEARRQRHGPRRLGAAPPADALPHHHAPAVPPGAAAGERLLDHARLRAAGLQHDRPAGQGRADRRASRAWSRPAIRWSSAPSPTRSWTPTRRWSRACRCSRRAAPGRVRTIRIGASRRIRSISSPAAAPMSRTRPRSARWW